MAFSIVLLGRYLWGIRQRELSFARKQHYCPDMRKSVSAFISKLKLWSRRISRGVTAQFSTLDQFLDDNNKGQQFPNEAKQEIQEHLDELVHYLDRYFPDRETAPLQWCMQPFSVDEDQVADDDFPAKEEWIALRLNERKKVEF